MQARWFWFQTSPTVIVNVHVKQNGLRMILREAFLLRPYAEHAGNCCVEELSVFKNEYGLSPDTTYSFFYRLARISK